MLIRKAAPADYDAIYTLVKTAFQTARVSDGTEQDFVLRLREGPGFIPGLELVAEEDGRLAGHIMLTQQPVKGLEVKALLLAPLCVEISRRDQGLGGALIEEALRLAREKGYEAVFLVGNPAYYSRHGFRCVSDFGLRNGSTIPDPFVQGRELIENALAGQGGTISIEND
ncbi:MAG: N-acetyltransferase [Clostridiales bacterium]|nr:N-acetyltransferase [Clostridiales bacterium]